MTGLHRRQFDIRLGAVLAVCAATVTIAASGGSTPAGLKAESRALTLDALLPQAGDGQARSFDEQFNAPALDPAWQVMAYTGARVYGYPPPANDFSLTDNPGYLRYILSPMTYHTGYLNDFQPIPAWTYSCCPHDPGLELHRTFGGDNWRLESKVVYFMPYTNGRALQSIVYFGDGGPGTVSVNFARWRDVHVNAFSVIVSRKTGPHLLDYEVLEEYSYPLPLYGNASATFTHRLERDGNVLTATWSQDDVTWTPVFSRDMETLLDGLGQRVVIAGLSWFNTGGSYADHDYVTLIDTAPLQITSVAANPAVLWPPNHQMVAVQIAVSTTNDEGPVGPDCRISGVSSSEPVNGLGDGDAAPDWTAPAGLTVNLRAERAAWGSGRSYTLAVTCTDTAGRVATKDVTVSVPRDRGKK